ncbi:phosphotyrosine protein phosphatase [Candidatus Woesearchaeota archaeon]|nr:phosphotyrosine protein phosphatase [Candidatus Woesearchaeota archaeon]
MKLLFICNQNLHRSKTAELIFKDEFEVDSAGLYGGKALDAATLESSDLVLVMEEFQRSEIARRFPKQYLTKRILCLDIPNRYNFNQPELISLLQERMKALL